MKSQLWSQFKTLVYEIITTTVTNAAEYGMGGHPSALGDIYSYGILLLEIFTGKRPTDEAFEGVSMHGNLPFYSLGFTKPCHGNN